MKYQKTVLLKNGTPCLVRNASGGDAQAVLEAFEQTHRETDFLLSYPDENSFDSEQEREFLNTKASSKNEIELCAVVGGQIAGTAGIDAAGRWEKIRHRAEFGIGVRKAFWGLGIGRALTEACIECAKDAGYAQLELDVVSENTAALSLYKSLGFREYGRNPLGFRSRASGWQELVLMRLELDSSKEFNAGRTDFPTV